MFLCLEAQTSPPQASFAQLPLLSALSLTQASRHPQDSAGPQSLAI